MAVFEGCCTAMVTPFDENGINYNVFKKHIEFQIENGINALLVCGTTGEPSTMSHEEKIEAIKFMVKTVDGRVPVIAGTGGYNTANVIKLSKEAEEIGVDALLVVTPYYNKTNQKGLVNHFKMVADAVSLPIIIYNVPSRTGLNMTPETLCELTSVENIVGMKEASGDMAQVVEMCRLCRDSISIYSGCDHMIVPSMSVGGVGVISVVSNIVPADTVRMAECCLAGDYKQAMEIQLGMIPLIDALFTEVSPIPVKTAMNLMGMDAGLLRLPLYQLSEEYVECLEKELNDYGLL